MRKIELYEDQREFVIGLRDALKAGHKSILGVASPAFGKTVVAGHIISEARAKRDATSWFLVHRKNLLRQTSKSFWAAGIEHGLITSGKSRSKLPIQVGTIGTVYSRMESLVPPSILFVDEAHLSRGNMFETVIKWVLENGGIVIGLTGTPIRLDGKSLGDLFTVLVEAKPTSWLIEHGRLSRYEMYTTPLMPDLSKVDKSGGDYNVEQLAEVMSDRVLVGDAVSHWQKLAAGKRTVVYCCNVAHSKKTCDAFNDAGIPAVHVDASSTEADIKAACEGLASGRYLILCNCELVIEGFDLSAQVGKDLTLECCVLLRPTQSVARYLQMVFRALRRKPQPAMILDHAGCAIKHGLPDEDRFWSLDGAAMKERAKAETFDVRQCPMCYNVYRAHLTQCPKCHAEGKKTQREIEIIKGELKRIELDEAERQRRLERREVGMSKTLEDLIGVGIRKGMNRPAEWAANLIAARQKRRANRSDYEQARKIYTRLKTQRTTTEVF